MPHADAPLAIRVLLLVHVAAGSLALAIAPLAMIARKGGTWHRRWGTAFAIAMATVAVTAFGLGPYFQDLFLVAVGVLSGYLVYAAWRAARVHDRVAPVDVFAAVAVLIAGLALLLLAFVQHSAFAAVLAMFGAICVVLGAKDLYRVSRPAPRKAWMYRHLTLMLAAYIAAVTAFSAVNLHMIPLVARWIWPTVTGTLLITWANVHYRKPKRPRAERSAVRG
ncbi:MAG TPA: hypothetical protein VIW69_17020 [Candidatus Elarobacter sp.]